MLRSLKKMFKSNYLFTLGVIICLAWIIAAILAPAIAPYDPVVQDLTARLQAPSAQHWFGTDNFGRDIFSRVIRILMKEVIPNSITSVLIMATTDIGNQILMFSTLSFLGLGSAPPTPEWGMMVSDGVDYFNKFWVAGFPGLAIFTMAVGANFIGDGLRDLLDPKLRKQF